TPTPDQIEDVQTYLTNLIAFYDTFHDYAQDKINICYSFESITEPSDPGNDWALSLLIKVALTLASSLSALAGLGEVSQAAQVAIKIGLSSATGIANSIYGNFKTTGGMDGSLNKEFAFIWDRFSTTLLQVREQLTSYYSNVAQNWNQTFTDPYTQRSFALNALTNTTFPMSSESLFQQYLDSALAMFEYFLWQDTISSQFVMNMGDSGNDWPYAQALPDAISSCNQNGRYYQFLAYIIWNSPTNPHTTANSLLRAQYAEYYLQRAEDNAGLANAAANYLFIDNGLGSLVNPQGIAYRGDVFHSWGVGKVESGFLFPFPAQMVGS